LKNQVEKQELITDSKQPVIKGRFVRGVSGNPAGRPKSRLPELIRQKTNDGQVILDAVFKILTKSHSDRARMQAAEFMRDTGFGKPAQQLEHGGLGGGPIIVEPVRYG
jgi:hypothetical protein